ncbi:MAG: NAD(+) diphosphatase [Bacteroidales bacterium]|nr:NAD(+) diphosphatase [Candidatus Cryptobacteroides choladohippi]
MRGYLNWRSSVRFCPSCGAMLEDHPVENARVCPECGKVQYPRIEPCVIAVICRGKEILLLRHAQRNQDIWCCLAGFVEAGESLEQALRREVKEETGLEIGNIRYAGSQSWPFPDQLMVGFYADYAGGDIVLQESEILEAGWFRTDNLPPHPSPGSISWNLIHFMPITNE